MTVSTKRFMSIYSTIHLTYIKDSPNYRYSGCRIGTINVGITDRHSILMPYTTSWKL